MGRNPLDDEPASNLLVDEAPHDQQQHDQDETKNNEIQNEENSKRLPSIPPPSYASEEAADTIITKRSSNSSYDKTPQIRRRMLPTPITPWQNTTRLYEQIDFLQRTFTNQQVTINSQNNTIKVMVAQLQQQQQSYIELSEKQSLHNRQQN